MAQIKYKICYAQGDDRVSPEVILTRPDDFAAKLDFGSDTYDESVYNKFCDEAHDLCSRIHGFWGSSDWYYAKFDVLY